jgi:hypothetical protein
MLSFSELSRTRCRALAKGEQEMPERVAQHARFRRLTLGPELKMIELEKEITYLRECGPAQGGMSDDQH